MHKVCGVVALLSATLLFGSCGGTNSGAAPESRSGGVHQTGLDFVADTNVAGATKSPVSETSVVSTSGSSTLAEISNAFARAVVMHNKSAAFALLSQKDQRKIGSPERFELLLSGRAPWVSAKPSRAIAPDTAVFEVAQEPALDEVRGDIAPAATVQVPMVHESGGWRVAWSKNRIEQLYTADEARITTDATTWLTSRASCSAPKLEAPNGLLGVVGLAGSLCGSKGVVRIGVPDTLDAMDDPQPVLDAYGSAAANWARVVNISSPVAMQAVLAPLGEEWVVVALAHAPAAG